MALIIDAISSTDARAQVERILQSKLFRTSEVLCHLFAYLANKSLEGTGDDLKEYTIGLDALGKPASFDPRQESVVRMHTARMRQKLSEYYRTEGTDDPVIVDMPKGGFKVTFEPRRPVTVQAEVHESPRGWRSREIVLVSALAITVSCAAHFMTRLWRVEGADGPGAILMLSGNQIASVMGGVQAFTNPALAQMLVSRLQTGSGGIPKYFQVVLSVKAMDDVPVKIEYMFHRELSERGQRTAAKQ
jgi:hypothetical protein